MSLHRGNFAFVWSEPILHVDMDSFFVEVERLSDPNLNDVPVAVGGVGPRGVVASASYEARQFGVESAMPTASALRLCPQLVVVSPAHGKYGEISEKVFEIFRSITPLVEGLSLDEAFLDVAGLSRHYDRPLSVAEEIRSLLRQRLGLPASVGIAATKFVAKLASKRAKPDGICLVEGNGQAAFLARLPVTELWGVGPATMAALARFGIETVGDLAEVPETTLSSALGPAQSRHLIDLARGIDNRSVVPEGVAKSISAEETFPVDLADIGRLEVVILAQAQRIAGRLRRAGLRARSVTLKLRFGDFTTITRSRTLDSGVDTPRALFSTGKDLLAEAHDGRPVRLIGLGAASLEAEDRPQQLGIDDNEAWEQVSDAVYAARERFGAHAVEPARLIQFSGGETDDQG